MNLNPYSRSLTPFRALGKFVLKSDQQEVVQYEVCRMSTIGIAGSTARFHGKSKNSTNGRGARWYTWMISRLFSYVSDALFEELTSGSGFCNGASRLAGGRTSRIEFCYSGCTQRTEAAAGGG
ncbi:hypothetical protein TB2_009265 [Malus domestica]